MIANRKTYSITITNFEAVIFDLDGVVTDTATVHAEAWKKMFDDFLSRYAAHHGKSFQSFDIESDYLLYVDGKPRLDGLKSFFESRGIEIPEGEPTDSEEEETIHGLGKMKNRYFLEVIKKHGPDVYTSTVKLIHRIKKFGLKTAIISSSKNCAMILDVANLSDLFDVRVDGVDSEILGIAGKPAPDIFLQAAKELKVKPGRSVVVEDALSGVQAGRAGNFGLVIGIARAGNKDDLLDNGADIAVEDLDEISIQEDLEIRKTLPSALKKFDQLYRQIEGKRMVVFLDYDGTLTPIVDTPDKAIMHEDMRNAVIKLSQCCTVGIISGRDLQDIQHMVKIDSILYAGSHGFDISSPEDLEIQNQIGEEFLPILDEAEKELSEKLQSIDKIIVERKKFAIAIHYRLVEPKWIETIEKVVDEVATKHIDLRKAYGKKIFELQPDIDWHKGKALLTLLKALKLDRDDVLPIYIGDDVTDEDAFRALQGRGIGIVVWSEPYETAASYSLKNPDEVRDFLLKIVSLCQGGKHA